jgi:hypothetical protein
MSEVRSVFIPYLNKSFFLGRNQPPPTCDYTEAAPRSLSNVYLNDRLGCCVISAGFHVKGVLSANAGKEIIYSDRDVINYYSAIGGYVEGNPSTDRGCNEQNALNYLLKRGYPDSSKLTGYLAVNPNNPKEYKTALWLFENLFYGVGLPDSWLNNPKPDFVWDADRPNNNNGHCFIACGYNENSVKIDTWGMLGYLTDRAHSADVDELYVLLDEAMINKAHGKAPNGFDWSQLIADFNAIGGNVVPPGPGPGPAPSPNNRLFGLSFSRNVLKGSLIEFAAPVNVPVGKYYVVEARSAEEEPLVTAYE